MIPKHLEHITFKPSHFYRDAKGKPGKQWSLVDDCTTDIIQEKGLTIEYAKVTQMVAVQGGIGLAVEVAIRDGKRVVPGVASETNLPGEKQPNNYHAQKAVTRALKNCIERLYGIRQEDINAIVDHLGLGKGQKAPTESETEPEAPEVAPEEQLADNDAAAKLLELG